MREKAGARDGPTHQRNEHRHRADPPFVINASAGVLVPIGDRARKLAEESTRRRGEAEVATSGYVARRFRLGSGLESMVCRVE